MKRIKEERSAARGLFQKDFTLMVIGQIISLFGNSMLRFALSMTVLDLTGSAAQFAGISALSMIPTVLLSPIGGVLADRASRKGIMAALDFFTAGLLTVFLLLFQAHPGVVLIGGMMMILSVIESFYSPAVNSSIPLLVSEDRLVPANGVVTQINALASLFGPVLGGVLYGLFGLKAILPACIVCFFFSAVMECFLQIPYEKRPAEGGVLRTIRVDFSQAIGFLTRDRRGLLQLLPLIAGLNLVFSAMLNVGLPYVIKIQLGLSNQLYGLAAGAMSVGMILGGLLSGTAAKRVSTTRIYLFLLITGAAAIPFGAAVISNRAPMVSFVVILLSAVAMTAGSSLYSILCQALVQRLTPPELLGKVMAVVATLAICAMPAGQALYGLLFDWAGNSTFLVIWLGGLFCVLLALPMKRSLKRLERE